MLDLSGYYLQHPGLQLEPCALLVPAVLEVLHVLGLVGCMKNLLWIVAYEVRFKGFDTSIFNVLSNYRLI